MFTQKYIDELKIFLSTNKNNFKGKELEWKLGSTINSKYIPSINSYIYKICKDKLSKTSLFNHQGSIFSKVDYYPNDIRVITINNSNVFIEKKKRIRNIDYSFSDISCRLSLSFEEIYNSDKIKEEKILYTRNRKRDSFFHKDGFYKIDFTEINSGDNQIQYEIEIEFLNPNLILDDKTLIEPLRFLLENIYDKNVLITPQLKQEVLTYCNNLLVKLNPKFISNDRYLLNFTNKPRNIKKGELNNKYSVTNKLDGIRYQLFCTQKGIFIAHPKDLDILYFKNIPELIGTILEGEWYKGDFYIFDVLIYRNEILIDKSHDERVKHCVDILKIFNKNELQNIYMKKFFYLENVKDSLIECMRYVYEKFGENVINENDGFIFTPVKDLYINNHTLKYKYESTMSIDFLVKRIGLTNIYDIFVGGDNNINIPFSFKGIKYKMNNKSNMDIIDNDIIECTFSKSDNYFIPIRNRNMDKNRPNYYKIAEDVFDDILNPIGILELINTDSVVIKNCTKNFRKFHNREKLAYIKKYCNNVENVLDLGFGRGGDLLKYTISKTKKVWGVDPSKENLDEALKRYNDKENNFNIELEVLNEQAQNTERIKNFLKGTKVDVVSMFFSLTFFFNSENNLINLINTIKNNLKDGGKFIGFTMDGDETYKWLKGKDKLNYENCYTIIKKYNDDDKNIFGKEIEIDMVDGTIVSNQTEWLVSFNDLVNLLEKNNIHLIETSLCEPPLDLGKEGIEISSKTRKFVFEKKHVDNRIPVSLNSPDIVEVIEKENLDEKFEELNKRYKNIEIVRNIIQENKNKRLLEMEKKLNIEFEKKKIEDEEKKKLAEEELEKKLNEELEKRKIQEEKEKLDKEKKKLEEEKRKIEIEKKLEEEKRILEEEKRKIEIEKKLEEEKSKLEIEKSKLEIEKKLEEEIEKLDKEKKKLEEEIEKDITKRKEKKRDINIISKDVGKTAKIKNNWLPSKYQLIRTGTVPDGSCFFHSLMTSLASIEKYKIYLEVDNEGKKEIINNLRKKLSEMLNVSTWEKLGKGRIAYFTIVVTGKFHDYVKKKIKEEIDFNKIKTDSYYISEYREKLEEYLNSLEINEDLKTRVLKIFDLYKKKMYETYKKNLADPSVWVGLDYTSKNNIDAFEYVSNILKVDIYIIHDSTRRPYETDCEEYKSRNKKSIFMLSLNDNSHFESIGTYDEKTKVIERVFEPNNEIITLTKKTCEINKEETGDEIQGWINKMFPPVEGVDRNKLKLTSISKYSTTPFKLSNVAVDIIKHKLGRDVIVLDANACVGGDTINFALNFKKVYSVEIDEVNYRVLNNNIKVYNLKNVITYNENFLKIEELLYKLKPDVIYFDPPWGGKDYKESKSIDLYLDNENIKDIINRAIDKCKLILCKVPFNLNMEGFNTDKYNIEITKLKKYNILCFQNKNV